MEKVHFIIIFPRLFTLKHIYFVLLLLSCLCAENEDDFWNEFDKSGSEGEQQEEDNEQESEEEG